MSREPGIQSRNPVFDSYWQFSYLKVLCKYANDKETLHYLFEHKQSYWTCLQIMQQLPAVHRIFRSPEMTQSTQQLESQTMPYVRFTGLLLDNHFSLLKQMDFPEEFVDTHGHQSVISPGKTPTHQSSQREKALALIEDAWKIRFTPRTEEAFQTTAFLASAFITGTAALALSTSAAAGISAFAAAGWLINRCAHDFGPRTQAILQGAACGPIVMSPLCSLIHGMPYPAAIGMGKVVSEWWHDDERPRA